MKKAVVLLSGGLGSAPCLAMVEARGFDSVLPDPTRYRASPTEPPR